VLFIFAIPAVVVLLVVAIVGAIIWWPLAILSIPAAAATVWFLWQRAHGAVLSSLNVRPPAEREGARILNVVESLCLSTGIDQPEVMVIDSQALNVATLSGRENTLVATSGLLATMNAMEMEGVVAHSLSKIATGASEYETLIASAPWAVSAPQKATAREWGVNENGAVQFDLSGVELTRYPPGLRSALERIAAAETEIPGGEALGSAWLVPPAAIRVPVEHRIEVLGEL
jgi:heat shock protein HtpX